MLDVAYGEMPYGAHFASGSDLYKTFVKPFTDVVQVAAGKTKEMSVKTQTMLKLAFEAVATTLIPFLSSDYGEIFAKEKEAIDKIRSEYGEVYGATWEALKNNDVAMAAFFCYPTAVLTAGFAKKTPETTMKVLSVLSGGTIDSFLNRVKNAFGGGMGSSSSGGGGSSYSPGGDKVPTWESLIREDEEKKKKKKKKPALGDVLTNKKVVKKALNSPVAQRMQKDAREVVQNTLKTVLSRAEAVASAKSLEDLQKKIGKPLKGLDKLKSAKQEERVVAEKQILANVKKSMKEFYAKSLEAQAKQALDAGIPEDSGFIKEYRGVIQKIRSL